MRSIVTYLTSTLAAAVCSTATAQEPDTKPPVTEHAQIALTYVKRLAKGDIDITKHTALSEHCSIQRRKEIRVRLESLKENYFHESDTYSIETQKIGAHLAGVLIRAENTTSPLSTRVHAVALIKKGGTWKAAPLLGRFSNTGYGYDEKVELAVKSMERWMAREKNLRETRCRENATAAFKTTLTELEKKAGLNTMNPEEAVTHFLDQCRSKNLMGILASMGGASDQLLDPMETTISLVSQGLLEEDTDNDWYLVSSRSVIAQVMKVDLTRNEVAIGFYNPLERGKSKVLYFPTHKSDGKTFVRLSPLLKNALLPEIDRWQQQWKHQRGDENELRKKLPTTIFKNNQPVSYPTAAKLLEHFLASLKKDNFADCLRLSPRKGDYYGKEKNHQITLINLGALWRSIHKLKNSPRHTFDILEEKNIALAPLQYAKTNRNGEFQTIKVWMMQDTDGWHIISSSALSASLGDDIKASAKKLEERFLSLEKERQNQHAKDLLDEVITLTPPVTAGPVPEENAKALFTKYRAHLRARDTQAALSSCAVLKDTNNTQTLKTFNYALRGAADHTNYDHLFGATQAGKWIGLSVRTESKLLDLKDYPLYLIVQTDKGPKVLLDIDLRHATNKGRKILNKKNWDKLTKSLPKDSLDDVKAIFAAHLKLTAKDVEEVLKLRE